MGIKLKNITKAIFVESIIVFCVTVGLVISIVEATSLSDLFTNKKYYESETHRREIEKDLNKLIRLQESNSAQTNFGIYESTTDASETKFYNKNMPDELKNVNYTYFFAHYSFYRASFSFRSDNYDQYKIFNDFYNKFSDNKLLLSENSNYYDAEPDFILSFRSIVNNNNTYIVRHKEISSHGNYVNDKISFEDLSDYNKGLTNILVIISYSDEYLLNADKNWHKLSVVFNILTIISILAFFYIISYIVAKYRYHVSGNNYEYLKNPPKYWDLVIIVAPIAILKCYLIRPLFALIPAFILMLYLCCELLSLLYAVKSKTLFKSSLVVKIARFIKNNKNKIYSVINKLSFFKKLFI